MDQIIKFENGSSIMDVRYDEETNNSVFDFIDGKVHKLLAPEPTTKRIVILICS